MYLIIFSCYVIVMVNICVNDKQAKLSLVVERVEYYLINIQREWNINDDWV